MKTIYLTTLACLIGYSPILAQQTPEPPTRNLSAVSGPNLSGLAPASQVPAGFVMINGNVYIVAGGRITPLAQEMVFMLPRQVLSDLTERRSAYRREACLA